MNKLRREKTQTYPPRIAYAKWIAFTCGLTLGRHGHYAKGMKSLSIEVAGFDHLERSRAMRSGEDVVV
jgi:hypothetical protein